MYPPAKGSDSGRLRGRGGGRWAHRTGCPPPRASSPMRGASRPPPPPSRAPRVAAAACAPARAPRAPWRPSDRWGGGRRHQRRRKRAAPPAPSLPRASVPRTGCQCRHRRARGVSSQPGAGGGGDGRRPGGGCRQRGQVGAAGGGGRERGAGRPAARARAQPAARGRAVGGGRKERGREPFDARPRRSRHHPTACGAALALPLGADESEGERHPPRVYSSPRPLPAAPHPASRVQRRAGTAAASVQRGRRRGAVGGRTATRSQQTRVRGRQGVPTRAGWLTNGRPGRGMRRGRNASRSCKPTMTSAASVEGRGGGDAGRSPTATRLCLWRRCLFFPRKGRDLRAG